jgi:hypothetical protein
MSRAWGQKPPAGLRNAWIRLHVLRQGQTAIYTLLGPLLGINTHWVESDTPGVKGRTILCEGADQCRLCEDSPRTWKGYIAAALLVNPVSGTQRSWLPTVAVITEEIGQEVYELKPRTVIAIKREGKKHNSPLRLAVVTRSLPLCEEESFDVKPYVLRAMGLGGENPGQFKIHRA